MIFLFLLSFFSFSWILFHAAPIEAKLWRNDYSESPDWSQLSWAQYTPFFPVEPYQDPPEGCKVTQANIIQRHGARFPTSGASKGIVSAVAKLQSVAAFTDPRMSFLPDFTYNLGQNDLLPFGAREASKSGADHFGRYSGLVKEDDLPFVRASGSERVILSATNWTAGFSAASDYKYNVSLALVISEELNNTLDDAMCPNAGSSDAQTDEWLSIYAPPITARLNEWAPGANLTDAETYSLLSLCAFHSLATENHSLFCDLFNDSEFRDFEYSGDLNKFYGTGYGQALGPVQGVGYINELIARLTNSPVQDHTQTNRTLDSDPTTFPLNRSLYVDFSHDNQMIAIYSAMGLFPQNTPLDPRQPEDNRTWIASKMVPFSARMITERIACEGSEQEFVRIFVNEALQALEICGAQEGNGMCSLEEFIASQDYARSNGGEDFLRCFNTTTT